MAREISYIVWIPCNEFLPVKIGKYLVTTCHGHVTIDRWDGQGFGKCQPHAKNRGRYNIHKAWSEMPREYGEL